MRTPQDLPPRRPRAHTSRRFRITLLVVLVVLLLILVFAKGTARFYTSYLWFESVGFTSVFRGVLLTKLLLSVVFTIIFFLAMMASLTFVERFAVSPPPANDELVSRYQAILGPRSRWVRVVVSLAFALLAGVPVRREWNNFDLWRYAVPFHVTDPQWHRDVGFYVFKLPFIEFLLSWVFEGLVVIALVSLTYMYLNGGIRFLDGRPHLSVAVKTHLSLLLGLLAISQGFNYYYQRLALVLSTGHTIHSGVRLDGATATSVHANAPADELLIAVAVIAAVLFLVNLRVRGWTLPVVGVTVWLLVWIVIGNIYPAIYQATRVTPSEASRESTYITRNIAATRAAYGLSDVKVESDTDFDGSAAAIVNPNQIQGNSAQAVANRQTLSNVQLLDPEQIAGTVDRLQSLRPQYTLPQPQVDRYDLGGQETEALISARQLSNQVPSGFTTQHLNYTHGYGAVVTPANEQGVTADGDPNFSLKDIPPVGQPSLSGTGAQIYYNQTASANAFVVGNTKQAELNYEDAEGNENTSHYAGKSGVEAGSILRRAAFAVAFSNINLLLSGQITSHSRIMYNLNIMNRVEKAAPFLHYDASPYPVVLDNQLLWVVDAYTTTSNYPYSQQANTNRVSASSGLSGKFNYVRNSVKVVINAYTGKMNFFVVDPTDPIIKVYERAFPDLFTSQSKANQLYPGITQHWRYPQDLFKVQTNMYNRYHLTNASQFFTQANAWAISQDAGSGNPAASNVVTSVNITNGKITVTPKLMNPYYQLAALPGTTSQQFVLTQPFVAQGGAGRQNLTGVMYASSQPGSYGQLTVYETPPNETVDGPELVQSYINASSSISQQLTLFNQQGSRVLLGSVISVPVANTLLFVQPVYVYATNNPVPVLRQVIVGYDDKAYDSENASLDAALCQITNPNGQQPFASYCNTKPANRKTNTATGGGTSSSTPTTTTPSTSVPTTVPASPTSVAPAASNDVRVLLADANQAFSQAAAALKRGDLADYQRYVSLAQADVAKANKLEAKGLKS